MPPHRPTISERAALEAANFSQITELRLQLRSNGYSPIPVYSPDAVGPNIKSPGKQPCCGGWQELGGATAQTITDWAKIYRAGTNTGILTEYVVGVDIDVLHPELADKLLVRALEIFGPTPLRRIGRAPKILLCYRLEGPCGKLSTPDFLFGDDIKNKDARAKVEILARGQQFVSHGIHPSTREPYHWPDKSLLDIPAGDVPMVTLEKLQQFVAEAEKMLRDAGARTMGEISADIRERERGGNDAAGHRQGERVSYEKVADALNHIPNVVDRDIWINIGFAIQSALGDAGKPLWMQWSEQYCDYNEADAAARWPTLANPKHITVGTLFHHAGRNGWRSKDRSSANGHYRADERAGADAKPEPPRPLMREMPPADLFPVEALGNILGPAAVGIQDKVQAPMAICAQSVLAAATLAVQGFADIELPTDEVGPVSGFFISVAESGERKSTVDGIALEPIRKRQVALRAEHDERMPQYKNALIAWEKARDFAVKEARGDGGAINAALNGLGPEPVAPLLPMLTCSEPTYEGLIKLLAIGQPSIGIFSAEGGSFIGGHGMADEAIKRTATGLSNLWGGDPIDRVRSQDGASVLVGRRVSMHLMCQPDLANELLSNALLIDQGLMSRVLVSAPASTIGYRPWREAAEESNAAIQRYGDTLLNILKRPMPLASGKSNELSPPVIRLAPLARKMWTSFSDCTDEQAKSDGALHAIRGLAGKLPEHAARIAAVLALVADIEAREISADYLAAGITVAQYYATEALRMFEGSRINADLLLAQKLLNWLKGKNEPLISLPDIYQRGPNAIGDKATAARLVAILVDHGWLIPVEGGAEVGGHYRRDVFRIIKS
jgi:Protein of unknown function (DUF3987)/Primase C terminal 2 (PriCT-2)/Bifunctional DNA primase/polymerase, N-terminal